MNKKLLKPHPVSTLTIFGTFCCWINNKNGGSHCWNQQKYCQAFFHSLGEIIARNQSSGIVFFGEIEADESYFGGRKKENVATGPP